MEVFNLEGFKSGHVCKVGFNEIDKSGVVPFSIFLSRVFDVSSLVISGSIPSLLGSVRKRPVRSGLGSEAAGLGFFWGRPGRTVGFSPAFRAYLAGLQISAGFRVIRCD